MLRMMLVPVAMLALVGCERASPAAPDASAAAPMEPGLFATIPDDARELTIDFKPALGSDESLGFDVLSRKKKGTVTVALLGVPESEGEPFDVTTVATSTILFGRGDVFASPKHDFSGDDVLIEHLVDVDGNGALDLLFHFAATELGLGGLSGTVEFCLVGDATSGAFYGCVDVKIAG
jgi:hypothetical protein